MARLYACKCEYHLTCDNCETKLPRLFYKYSSLRRNMGVIEKAVEWAVGIANNNEHGYSQSVRWGPSYDCSSLVISAWEQAGVPVKTKGATYTGNMRAVFKQCGFEVLTSFDFSTYCNLKYGDVLLNDSSHTAMYVGNGKIVAARTSEGTCDTSDNSGNEITIQNYFNYPWNCVLRYTADTENKNSNTETNVAKAATTTIATASNQLIPTDKTGIGVAAIQGMLKYLGYSLGSCGVDGDAGSQTSYTNNALRLAVAAGKISKDTITYLLKL